MVSQQGYIGPPPDIKVGTIFPSRAALREAGLHRANQAGIVGTAATGAESVVVSGGYEDDEDHGDVIIYTGHGGRHPDTGKQIADQSPQASGNAALITSSLSGADVRVIRGPNADSPFAPSSGYQYAGLFRVDEHWMDRGKSGYLVCRYRLVSQDVYTAALDAAFDAMPTPKGNHEPGRTSARVQRLIRSSAVVEHVKKLYNYTCQICRTRLSLGAKGAYAEGAHIKALGTPHRGPDIVDNVLCLCPNCHVLFDHGAIKIDEDYVIRGGPNDGDLLFRKDEHAIDVVYLDYHRRLQVNVAPGLLAQQSELFPTVP